MGDIGVVFHWPPSEMEGWPLSELMHWREQAARRANPDED